jgi:hypothetical protein
MYIYKNECAYNIIIYEKGNTMNYDLNICILIFENNVYMRAYECRSLKQTI